MEAGGILAGDQAVVQDVRAARADILIDVLQNPVDQEAQDVSHSEATVDDQVVDSTRVHTEILLATTQRLTEILHVITQHRI